MQDFCFNIKTQEPAEEVRAREGRRAGGRFKEGGRDNACMVEGVGSSDIVKRVRQPS